MDQNSGAIKRKIAWAATIVTIMFNLSCGKSYDRVDTIKGPNGEKGDRGPEGRQGPQGPEGPKGDNGNSGNGGYPNPSPNPQPTGYPQPIPTAYPQPIPTVTVTAQPVPPQLPPVIVVQPPWPDCGTTPQCPSGNILVCACIGNSWQTISINVHDTGRFNIRNYGPCTPY